MTQPSPRECIFCCEVVPHEFTTPCCQQPAHTLCIEKIPPKMKPATRPAELYVPCPFCRSEWKTGSSSLGDEELPDDDEYLLFHRFSSDHLSSIPDEQSEWGASEDDWEEEDSPHSNPGDHEAIISALAVANHSLVYYSYADCEIDFLQCLLDVCRCRKLSTSELRAVEECEERCKYGHL